MKQQPSYRGELRVSRVVDLGIGMDQRRQPGNLGLKQIYAAFRSNHLTSPRTYDPQRCRLWQAIEISDGYVGRS